MPGFPPIVAHASPLGRALPSLPRDLSSMIHLHRLQIYKITASPFSSSTINHINTHLLYLALHLPSIPKVSSSTTSQSTLQYRVSIFDQYPRLSSNHAVLYLSRFASSRELHTSLRLG
jgi:hypothetical protein